MTQLSQISGIGKTTVYKLNKINIYTVNDIISISPPKLLKISYIGTSKIIKLYSTIGIPLTKSEIFKFTNPEDIEGVVLDEYPYNMSID